MKLNNFLVDKNASVKEALSMLNALEERNPIVFVMDAKNKLLGSLTDGDIRRAILNKFNLRNKVHSICKKRPKFIRKENPNIESLIKYRNDDLNFVPVLDKNDCIVDLINFRTTKSYLPVDAVLMAGGMGKRLLPITLDLPKPMIEIGETPIMEHNLKRLSLFGIKNFWISINYKGQLIKNFFKEKKTYGDSIKFIEEKSPLGTVGSVSLANNFKQDYVIIMNSDILTDLNFEVFFMDFIDSKVDVSMITIPYKVDIPFGVIKSKDDYVSEINEKPTYSFDTNGGIYLMKKSIIKLIPYNSYFDFTDFIDLLLKNGKKIKKYNFSGYWLDIGSHGDLEKAKIDIESLNLYK